MQRQRQLPTLKTADAALDASVAGSLRSNDANDLLYQIESSRDYDPAPNLEKIRCFMFLRISGSCLIS